MTREIAKRVLTMTAVLAITLSTGMAYAATLSQNGTLSQVGTGLTIAEAGVGLEGLGAGTKSIMIDIGGPVQAAILYWAVRDRPCPDDGATCTIPLQPYQNQALIFDGHSITGTTLGSKLQRVGTVGQRINNIGYRADVTRVVQAAGQGLQAFTITDGDTANHSSLRLNGAGLVVLYTDASDPIVYEVIAFDGLNFAFGRVDKPAPAQVTKPVTFTYASSATTRMADFVTFTAGGTPDRPNRIDISNNLSLVNQIVGIDGVGWDTLQREIDIPAGSSSTIVQVFSEPFDERPDSLLWQFAALRIPIDEQNIEIVKEVSVNDGVTFFDANDSTSAPSTIAGGNALYRITVTNTGTADLENVVVDDDTLGVDFLVGDLVAGQIVVLTQDQTPKLDHPGRCQIPGAVTNTARAVGQSVDTGITVSDTDPAVIRCVEEAIDTDDVRGKTNGRGERI